MVAIDGGTIVGWFGGAVGIVPAPDEGARFRAGAVWTSGTAAGGTGGGRSWNIWAETGAGSSPTNIKASASAGKGHPRRLHPTIPLLPEIMTMLFTENAANSSSVVQIAHRRYRNWHRHPILMPRLS